MEFLGYVEESPRRNRKGEWNCIELEYETSDEFNDATGKIVRGQQKDWKYIIADENNVRYFVELLEARYDIIENVIKLFPNNCWKTKK